MVEGRYRELPSVDRLASELDAPHPLAVAAARAAIAARRRDLSDGREADGDLLAAAREQLERIRQPSLRPVINATGVIVHTNLGRAPLPAAARAAVTRIAEGYCGLELELDNGRRGSRHAHVAHALGELTGAGGGLAVNNGAGAVLLAVAALAGRGGTVVVSRGQLVEIGGGFRIPEVIEQAGARLVEVGTTNRTRIEDYERALARAGAGDRVVILRVHPSNFRTLGFVETPEIEPLTGLGVPVIDDLGSGALARELELLAEEPDVRRSLRAGAALVCFSGDKLLGGPQAGILVGEADAVRQAERHPLARALRIDKLSLAALEATLALYRDPASAAEEIPVLRMLAAGERELAARAEAIRAGIGARACVVPGVGRVGGGALPLAELHGPVVSVDPAPASAESLAARLRAGPVAVIGRISDDRLVLDPRTLTDVEAGQVGDLVAAALKLAAPAAT